MFIKKSLNIVILGLLLFSCASQNNDKDLSYYPTPESISPALLHLNTVIIGKSDGDYATVEEALMDAPENITRFILKEGVYTESGLIINRDIEIIGSGRATTIIQGAGSPGEASNRIFTIQEERDVVISNLTIRNGVPGEILRRGGGILNLGTLRMDTCDVMDNRAVYGAGMDNRGRAIITNSRFSGNDTLPMNKEERLTGVGCTGSGGGIKNEPGGILTMEGCEISGNSTLRRGGGLFVSCESRAFLNNCVITGNYARRNGGGIYLRGDLTLTGCEIKGNTSAKTTGGVYNMGYLNFSSNTITDNSGKDFTMGSGGAGFYGKGILGINEKNLIENF
ncbi:MAG: hypothetical protein JEY99_03910 [Spirochaetales bacterium]|nr:hypothetical protein [Spirochaetales bacterium]